MTLHLPPEVAEAILIHIPININLGFIAVASKTSFAPVLLESAYFANHHFKHHLLFSEREDLWDYLDHFAICHQGFRLLPKLYKHTIYLNVLMTKHNLKAASSTSSIIIMSHLPWEMSPHHAFETITTFLQSPGFDPSANDNRALQFACRNGHLEVVALLVSLPAVDPESALEEACCFGHVRMVEFLLKLKDPRISPFGNIAHLRVAAGNGQLDLVKVLLEDERFYLRGEISLALRAAVMGNHIAVVELLLKHPWVDPNSGSMQNNPILQASALGFLDIVKLLLDHPKINPTIWNFQALANALEKGHFDVVQLLLADYEVRCCVLGLEILDIGSHQEGDTINTRLLLAQGTGKELEIKCTQAFLQLLNETEESVEE